MNIFILEINVIAIFCLVPKFLVSEWIMLSGHLKVAKYEGNKLADYCGDPRVKAKKDCITFCESNSRCKSFTYCTGCPTCPHCHLKDLTLVGNEDVRNAGFCTSYYHGFQDSTNLINTTLVQRTKTTASTTTTTTAATKTTTEETTFVQTVGATIRIISKTAPTTTNTTTTRSNISKITPTTISTPEVTNQGSCCQAQGVPFRCLEICADCSKGNHWDIYKLVATSINCQKYEKDAKECCRNSIEDNSMAENVINLNNILIDVERRK